jgi:hypothetical protein
MEKEMPLKFKVRQKWVLVGTAAAGSPFGSQQDGFLGLPGINHRDPGPVSGFR